jgi:hypothetical protein
MLSDILANLRSRKTLSVANLQTALAQLDVTAAEKKVDELEAERRRVLLDGNDADVTRVEKEIAAACLAVERTALARDEISRRLEQAVQVESEDARRERYEAARAQVAAASALIQSKYVTAALQIARIIASVEEAEHAAQAVNADLPAGAAPLIGPESLARQKQGKPEEIVSTKVVERWVLGTGGLVRPDHEHLININAKDASKGVLRNIQSNASSELPVERRRFYEVRFHPHEARVWEDHLAKTVRLPGVKVGDLTFWPHVADARPAKASAADARPIEVRHEPIIDTPAEQAA